MEQADTTYRTRDNQREPMLEAARPTRIPVDVSTSPYGTGSSVDGSTPVMGIAGHRHTDLPFTWQVASRTLLRQQFLQGVPIVLAPPDR